uniref:UBC core domain-containing protein n=1 Tax=Ditylenchus dipsaci TaxID=166011 RepID=A0A915D324_9BILA
MFFCKINAKRAFLKISIISLQQVFQLSFFRKVSCCRLLVSFALSIFVLVFKADKECLPFGSRHSFLVPHTLRLQNELRELKSNVDAASWSFKYPNETNFSLVEGCYFPELLTQSIRVDILSQPLSFPDNYILSLRQFSKFTNLPQSNVYPDGTVCISILHPPKRSYQKCSGDWKENKSTAYTDLINVQIEESKAVASTDGIAVPLTQEQYLKQSQDAKKASDAAAKDSEMDLTNDPIDFTDDNQDE